MSKELNVQDIIDWCDKVSQEEGELALVWEGGGDSGWCFFEIDGEQSNCEESEWLVSKMDDLLGYGSWAGEFSANGRAVYNIETKTFVGIDYYIVDEGTTFPFDEEFFIKVPKTIAFDQIAIITQGNEDDFETTIILRNGFVDKALYDGVVKSVEEQFQAATDETLLRHDVTQDDVSGYWHTYVLERKDFIEDGDFLKHHIEDLQLVIQSTDENEKTLDLFQMLEEQ